MPMVAVTWIGADGSLEVEGAGESHAVKGVARMPTAMARSLRFSRCMLGMKPSEFELSNYKT